MQQTRFFTYLIAFFTAAALFAACIVETDDVIATTDDSETITTDAVTEVTINGAQTISYNGSATLTATAVTTGTPTVTYTWSITKGSAYGNLSATTGKSVVVTANNTTDSAQGIKVKVVASDGNNTCKGSFTVTVAANGTVVANEITSVAASASSKSIAAKGTTTLSATATYTGNLSDSDITYTWTITDGSDYALLTATSGASVLLTGTNTTDSAQTVMVQVAATDGTNTRTATLTLTVAAKATTSDTYNATATIDTARYANTIYVDVGSGLVSADNATWEEVSTTATQPIANVKIKYTEDDSGNATGLLKINARSMSGALAVYISGTNDTSMIGGIRIQSNASDTVAVYLHDATITSTNYPCVEVTKGSPAIVHSSGTNTFVDGRSYGTGYGEEYATTSGSYYTDDDGNTVACTVSKSVENEGSDSKGTLFCKGNLTLTGSGTLNITQAYKNCIASKDGILTIDSGTLSLKNYTSSSNTGKNGLFGGQGVVVNDGTITFDGKGIVSTTDLRKANGFNTDDDTYPNSSVRLNGGTVNVTTYNGKGITAPYVYLAGGTNTFVVTGTTTYAERSSTGTYYDADGVKQTNATIKFAAEGVEGAAVVHISDGVHTITATDDGINCSNTGGQITVSGGYTYVYATGGDGIDSNGNIAVSGGVIVSIALTGSEDALDWGDGSYTGTVTGGHIAGLCGNVESPSVSGAGVVIYNKSTAVVTGGQTIAIGTESSVVYAFTVPSGISSYTNLVMGSADMTGSSYTVYKNCTVSGGASFNGLYYEMPTISSNGTTATVALSNHLYSNGSGMGGGSTGGGMPGSGTSTPGGFGGGGFGGHGSTSRP